MGAKKKAQYMKSMPFETLPPAQTIMRDEMAAGVHQPITAGAAVDELFGGVANGVTDMAVDIISKGANLQLSFTQWVIVQGLIEEGIRAGYDFAQSEHAADIGG